MVKPGERVRFNVAFLRSTGQYTGDEAPTHWGPFARGVVLNTEPLGPETVLAIVRWDDGETTRVNTANLETIVK